MDVDREAALRLRIAQLEVHVSELTRRVDLVLTTCGELLADVQRVRAGQKRVAARPRRRGFPGDA